MGLFTRPLTPFSSDRHISETVDALVDTGAIFSLVPSPLLHRLGVSPSYTLEGLRLAVDPHRRRLIPMRGFLGSYG